MEAPPASKPRISVSIVVHNSCLTLLRKTLCSLDVATDSAIAAGVQGVEVVIVDNDSTPSYRQQLTAVIAALAPGSRCSLELRELPSNLGFGAGHNTALRHSLSDYYLVLNPDVELEADTLARGYQRLRDEQDAVLLSPRAEGAAGAQEFLCKRYPSLLVLVLRAFLPRLGRHLFPGKMADYEMSDVCATGNDVAVPLASGCFMFVRTAQLSAVGGFDERYFLYFEDFDLCLRLGSLGRILYTPELRIVHHGGYAASKGWRHLQMFAGSGLRFFRQHGWRWI